MQVGFDKSTLAVENDVALTFLRVKAEKAIDGWNQLRRALDQREQVWFDQLKALVAYIDNLLNTRYGCND